MIGASKINQETDDLDRLFEMYNLGLNNAEISRIYRTNSGKTLSRIHISQIRRGQRWNINNRSFLMKVELDKQDSIKTSFNGNIIKSIISQVITDTEIYHLYLTYVNDKPMIDSGTSLMINKPTRNDLIEFHIKLVNEYNKKNTEDNF